jgi:arginyl-tRNA synthetase
MAQSINALLQARFRQAFDKASIPQSSPVLLGQSVRPDLADYQANGVMAAAKQLKSNPRQLAQLVLDHLQLDDVAESVEVAGPGFINVRLRTSWLAQRLEAVAGAHERLIDRVDTPQTIVVDYSGPNLAKEMHVGHLRSTIIGDSIVRVLERVGHRVIRQNHVGDWGTQFGMLIAFMIRQEQQQGGNLAHQLADLESFYRDAKKQFDADEDFARLAREYVVKLQAGDEECLQHWHRFVGESLYHCEAVYQRLGVSLRTTDVRAESAYNDALPGIISQLDAAGLLSESEGAKVVFLDSFMGKDDKPLPAIVQKSDGGYLYTTTDLAAMQYRCNTLRTDRILYFVDSRQALHLQQVFAISRRAGFATEHCSLEHHAFGTMMGADGKPFKTRTGGTVKLMELLEEAEQRAYTLVCQKNPELDEEHKRAIAAVVGIGAVKYADLSKNRTSDYIFNWDSMLSFEGNTAPYLQYAYARIKSIFRKGGIDEQTLQGPLLLEAAQERLLALKLLQFTETVQTVAVECFPNELCCYLYELAGLFMSFYENCPVLKADTSEQKSSRLLLSLLSAAALREGLELLGIGTVEQM